MWRIEEATQRYINYIKVQVNSLYAPPVSIFVPRIVSNLLGNKPTPRSSQLCVMRNCSHSEKHNQNDRAGRLSLSHSL